MPCIKNADGSKSCAGGGYSVQIASDGAILVKKGDSLSKYSMAIAGDFKHINDFRHRRHKPSGAITTSELKVIDNVDLILTGETLYHMPTRREGPSTKLPPITKEDALKAAAKQISNPYAACMVQKLIRLISQQQTNKWKAGWYQNDRAWTSAGILAKQFGGKYKDSDEQKYFLKFDQHATNVLSQIKKELEEGDIDMLAQQCETISANISEALSRIALWANKLEIIGQRNEALFFNSWMNRMMHDNKTVLSCYLRVYAPGGLK